MVLSFSSKEDAIEFAEKNGNKAKQTNVSFATTQSNLTHLKTFNIVQTVQHHLRFKKMRTRHNVNLVRA